MCNLVSKYSKAVVLNNRSLDLHVNLEAFFLTSLSFFSKHSFGTASEAFLHFYT